MTRFSRNLRLALLALAVLGTGVAEARAVADTHPERGQGADVAIGGGREGAGGIGGLVFERDHRAGTVETPLYRRGADIVGSWSLDEDRRVFTAEYGPFGEVIRDDGHEGRFGWSTKRGIPGSTLRYFGYRHYDTGRGTWLSRDPIGEAGGLALYANVANGPINWADPLGLNPVAIPAWTAGQVAAATATALLAWDALREESLSRQALREWEEAMRRMSQVREDAAKCGESKESADDSTEGAEETPKGSGEESALPKNEGEPTVPEKVIDTLSHIERTGSAPPGYVGGRKFQNDGRNGGEILPTVDKLGKPVNYREYDVNPYQQGVNRGSERLVIGSDGRAYYTYKHYEFFIPIK